MNSKCILISFFLTGLAASPFFGETLYVDSRNGLDANPGTQNQPVQTIQKAVELIYVDDQPEPATIKLVPGVHNLSKQITLKNSHVFTKQNRLTIEATFLPDDPNWAPKLMPVIISTEPATKSETESYLYSAQKYTIGFNVKTSHVTIRGIKFLGNPAPHTWHYPVWRTGKALDDLVVTQCLFVSDAHTVPYLSPICAMGNGIVADHCIFYNCHTPLIFWDAEGGRSKGCVARYCIIDGALAAVWTTQTAEDLDFHHNIITRSKYVWMRSRNNKRTYRLQDCVITDCKYNSGYGSAYELYGQTGEEITFKEQNVIETGTVTLEQGGMNTFDTGPSLGADWPKNYLHPTPGSTGYELGAGLFKK